MTMLLDEIVALSREYGRSPDWVIGGGGNTSIKDDEWMWVKASGTALGSIEPQQFVKMARSKLDAIWQTRYPEDREKREAQAKTDLFAARASGEENKRPSVEALMHALFPSRIVYHTHPTLVNALTCSTEGADAAARVLGDELLWIPMINPGYVLARRIYDDRRAFMERSGGREPRFILLQNHGLVVHGQDARDIRRDHAEIAARTAEAAGGTPPESQPRAAGAALADAAAAVRELLGGKTVTVPHADGVVDPFIADRDALRPLAGSLTPDHIVYAGHTPAWVERPEDLAATLQAYNRSEGVPPKAVVLRGEGVIGVGTSETAAQNACKLFVDAARIAHLVPAFGGMQFMPPEQVEFIRNWEVEKYRQQVSS
jgi:rhamnose utilization protein RhaD (predicted bifunctional aldolase and dehydrogenase)